MKGNNYKFSSITLNNSLIHLSLEDKIPTYHKIQKEQEGF